ncbi:MAG: DUF503 family protein [Bdellovibrionales bacterium]|nr:DUF503 family protein [Bdellovibrionales bacterium]
MFVAAAKILIDFYGNYDLPLKRAEMKKLALEVKKNFNASVAEIQEKIDDPERCLLGVAMTASTHADARHAIDRARQHIDNIAFARVVSEDVDIFQLD